MILRVYNSSRLRIYFVKGVLTSCITFAILRDMDGSKPIADTTILRKAGLTESQAKGYLALIEHGELSPTELGKVTEESRTNSYMICERLEKLGLAIKKEGKKALYTPAHPSALEALAEKRRKILVRNEQEVKSNLSSLVDLFYAHSEQPGAYTLQGVEGIRSVYEQTLQDKKDIYLIRTDADTNLIGKEFMQTYREKRATLGIHTYAITPKTPRGVKNNQDGTDQRYLYERVFFPSDSYSAPVEIDVFGDKVALIAFGETQMATVISSPPVAEAFRQVIQLLHSTLGRQ